MLRRNLGYEAPIAADLSMPHRTAGFVQDADLRGGADPCPGSGTAPPDGAGIVRADMPMPTKESGRCG